MNYYTLSPEVAGELGTNTVVDATVHPPVYERLHYEFVNWLGDELLEAIAAFIVTERVAEWLHHAGLSGFRIAEVEVSLSPTGEELMSFDKELMNFDELPNFWWLQVTGTPENDDFGISSDSYLVVSEKALKVLREGNIDNCLVDEI